MAIVKVKVDDATPEELRQHLHLALGIKVAANATLATLKAKLQTAQPGCSVFEISKADPDEEAPPRPPVEAAAPLPEQRIIHAEHEAAAERKAKTPNGSGIVGTAAKHDPKVSLLIPEEDPEHNPGGKRIVFTQSNGVSYGIPRGRIVEIPYRFYHSLKIAVKTVYSRDAETAQLVSSDVPQVPFQVYAMPTLAEVKAWTEAIDAAETAERERLEHEADKKAARRAGRAA